MLQALRKRVSGRWLIGGLLALAALALILYFLADTPEPDDAGQIQLVSEVVPLPAPTPPAPDAMLTAKMAPVPVVPNHANLAVADKAVAKMIDEKRDNDWAPRSEAAIRNFMRTIPYIGNNHFLTVSCKASTCEVTGTVGADPATGNMKPVWERLERDTAGSDLRAHGLERTAATFDTGRNGDEFKVYYRRVDTPSAQ